MNATAAEKFEALKVSQLKSTNVKLLGLMTLLNRLIPKNRKTDPDVIEFTANLPEEVMADQSIRVSTQTG